MILDVMDRAIRSALFWTGRIVLTVGAVLLILSDKMDATSMILNTPAEYAPTLLVVGFVLGLAITLAMSLSAYFEQDKIVARTGGEKIAYGMSYLSKNAVVTVIAGLAAIIVPGYYYATVGAVPTMDGCLMIGAISAIVVGLLGEKFANYILEAFRDKLKAADAREAKTETKE